MSVAAPFIVDAQLPAAKILTGPQAARVLRVPIEASGGRIQEVTARDVHYRPGGDVVVRFAVSVSWHGAHAVTESHMAASVVDGAHPGGVQVAFDNDGERTNIGVWRWPFDPILVGLAEAVNPSVAAELCGLRDPLEVELTVVAFRPLQRAVIRVTTPNQTFHLKVVPPREVAGLVDRHRILAEAGVPVARVVSEAPSLGIVVLAELSGSTWREGIASGAGWWPDASEFDRLAASLASVVIPDDLGAPSVRDRAAINASMLAEVLPHERLRLERISESIGSTYSSFQRATIHGDLHEGQVLIESGRVTGLLDVDDVGVGSLVDDRASMIAALRSHAVTRSATRRRVLQHAETLRIDSHRSIDPRELDCVTAAALVTLAAGPFRIRHRDWSTTVGLLLDEADRQLSRPAAASGTPLVGY